ncbi:ABC transporter ATP-binding protein [Caldinitratiruptor microaerophilus]|uniref:ABC transporter ATP-binding protein n=1 Tax=Caldinitratiruptor microaerophilus TaxID=671077 RepID=A0AA35CNG4_9FIRM|nr:ABC transporter ATP-binding protein [Caldinitratiruptor microaerophilus]BDG62417.1 ABC transporter ATP-binding protein [Caldinitratiruptor microaerophilus]
MALLEVDDLTVTYGAIRGVSGISLTVEEGEVVALIGANGAGKTTTLRAISRLVPSRGSIRFAGRDLTRLRPHEVTALGVVHVPEGRGIFPRLTVMENLELATWTRRRDREGIRRDLRRVFDLFPRLEERRDQVANTLSGGEQQMLALGRALMTRGRLMLLDEPSMGLAPVLVKEIFSVIQEISASGTTILLVEQNAHFALKIARRGYVLETGSIVLSGPAGAVAANPRVKAAYLGA